MTAIATMTKDLIAKGFETGKDRLIEVNFKELSGGIEALVVKGYQLGKSGLENLDPKLSAVNAKEWAKAHPYQVAFHTVGGLMVFTPGIITMPALTAVGYGVEGVTVGTITTGHISSDD